MAKVHFTLSGLSCQHCVRAVTHALQALGGVERVQVRLDSQQAIVQYDEGRLQLDQLRTAIEEEGYTVVAAELVAV